MSNISNEVKDAGLDLMDKGGHVHVGKWHQCHHCGGMHPMHNTHCPHCGAKAEY